MGTKPMKNSTMQLVFVAALVMFLTASLDAQQRIMPLNAGAAVSSVSNTYADSQTDTVLITREAGVTAMTFSAYWPDSVSVGVATLQRVVNGNICPLLVGDTLTAFLTYTGTEDVIDTPDKLASGNSATSTITMAPLAERYAVILVYETQNGGDNFNGTHLLTAKRAPTVKYTIQKTYGKH
jgi:hypothetical protein